MHEALLLAGLGCLAIVLLLAATCRPVPALQIAVPLACAVAVTAALLLLGHQAEYPASGRFAAGGGGRVNYALFFICQFARRPVGQNSETDWPVIEEQGCDRGGAARPSAVSLASTDQAAAAG